MVSEAHRPIILFDGVCNLCSFWARFVLRRDPAKKFRFAPLQSPAAEKIRGAAGFPKFAGESVVLIQNEKIYFKSAAALRVMRELGGAWPLLFGLIAVPRFLRDAVYDLIAKNRYRWFGRRDACFLPGPEVNERFL